MKAIRTFDTGATRDADDEKPDPEGYFSSSVAMVSQAYIHEWIEWAWAAGLFEGEGCISQDRTGTMPLLVLGMTDEESVRRFARIVRGGSVRYQQRQQTGRKPVWTWHARGKRAAGVLFVLYPYLGERRRAQAREVFGNEIARGESGVWLSPSVTAAFNTYMDKHRIQSNGQIRASDNWAAGIPADVYMKSMWRHFLAVWTAHRQGVSSLLEEEDLCALLFNVQGKLHELLKLRWAPPGQATP